MKTATEQPPTPPTATALAVASSDGFSGVELIARERARQISVEGWTPEHDDSHDKGELLEASYAYAKAAIKCIKHEYYRIINDPPPEWPWESEWWKPSPDAIRNLEKAGALLAAEIDRLKRAQGKPDEKMSHCEPEAAHGSHEKGSK